MTWDEHEKEYGIVLSDIPKDIRIYDVTKSIRADINDGEYGVSYGDTGSDECYHDDVKELFLELLDNDILDGVNETYNPMGYREYQFGVTSPTTLPAQPVNRSLTNTVQAAMASTTIPTDVQQKIYSYLKNNGAVTTKQIQSRLKGHPYTCAEIFDFLQKIRLMDPNTVTSPVSKRVTLAI